MPNRNPSRHCRRWWPPRRLGTPPGSAAAVGLLPILRCGLTLALTWALTWALAEPAAAADGTGTEFWFALQKNHPDKHPGDQAWLRLFIAAPDGAAGSVRIRGLGFEQAVNVPPGGLAPVDLPVAAKDLPDGAVAELAVEVRLDRPATVYALNRLRASTDAFLALPVDALGRDYRVLAYRSTNGRSQVAIVATRDQTEVLIEPAGRVRDQPAGGALRVRLDRGQVYSLVGATATVDLTGTRISANAPVAVLAGAECANVPPRAATCDHLVEMLPPLTAWGRRFLTWPLATRRKGDLLRVLADQADTTVQINGVPVARLAAGEIFEGMQAEAALIEADRPVLVGQYAVGTSVDQVVSDPFFVLVPPVEQYLDGYGFATPEDGFRVNFVNVILPDAALASLRLDGAPVPAERFQPIAGSGHQAAALALTPGSHRLDAAAPFGITVYGFDRADSYGYPGGMGLVAINPTVVNPLPPLPPPPPVRLGEQPPIDLGTLARRQAQQRPFAPVLLDHNGPVTLRVSAERPADGTRIELDAGAGWQAIDAAPLTLTRAPGDPPWQVRARTDGCVGPAAALTLVLELPGVDGAPPAQASAALSLHLVPTPWWVCLLPWLIALAVVIGTGIIAWGFILPARFPRQLGVQLADEEDVEQGFFLLLRAQRGTGAGFYRDARAWVRADFRVNGQPGGALARLRAGRGLIYLLPMRGVALTWQNAAGDWEPQPAQETPARVGTLYRHEPGGLYFMLRTR